MSYEKWLNSSLNFTSQSPVFKWIPICFWSFSGLSGLYAILSNSEKDHSFVYAIFLCTTVVFLIFLVLSQNRKARYAEAVSCFHGAMHHLRDASFSLDTNNDTQTVVTCLRYSVEHFSQAFTIITGVKCRACIKQIFCPSPIPEKEKETAMKVSTLCRSDDTNDHKVDSVKDNADFKKLFLDENLSNFFSNDLLREDTYYNSHWSEDNTSKKEKDYYSTIVWPIHKKLIQPIGDIEKHDLLGYLCIDNKRTNKFLQNPDCHFGAAYADALYYLLRKMKQKGDLNSGGKNEKKAKKK